MGEILAAFIELLLQLFAEVLIDFIGRKVARPMTRRGLAGFAIAGAGLALGWASVGIIPKIFITSTPGQFAYLLIAPLLAGAAMAGLGDYLRKRDFVRTRLESFGFGWLFAFSFALARYLLTR